MVGRLGPVLDSESGPAYWYPLARSDSIRFDSTRPDQTRFELSRLACIRDGIRDGKPGPA